MSPNVLTSPMAGPGSSPLLSCASPVSSTSHQQRREENWNDSGSHGLFRSRFSRFRCWRNKRHFEKMPPHLFHITPPWAPKLKVGEHVARNTENVFYFAGSIALGVGTCRQHWHWGPGVWQRLAFLSGVFYFANTGTPESVTESKRLEKNAGWVKLRPVCKRPRAAPHVSLFRVCVHSSPRLVTAMPQCNASHQPTSSCAELESLGLALSFFFQCSRRVAFCFSTSIIPLLASRGSISGGKK